MHNNEETNMLFILHCFKIARRDPFTTCSVYFPDTDVFLILIHFYPSLPQSLLFCTGMGKYARNNDIRLSYESIAPSMPKPCWSFMFLLAASRHAASQGNQKHFGEKKKNQRADEDILNPLGKLGKGLIATFTYNLHTETYVL